MLEKEIENLILDYLSYRPGYYWKNQSVGIYDPTKRKFRKSNNRHHVLGVADILGVKNDGQFVAIEVKTKTPKIAILETASSEYRFNTSNVDERVFCSKNSSRAYFEGNRFRK